MLVKHIPGQLNSSDLLTKELKDAALYRRLRDTTMVSRAFFLRHHHCIPAHMTDGTALPYYSPAAQPTTAMVTHDCSVVSSPNNKVTQGRLARNASPPSFFTLTLLASVQRHFAPLTTRTLVFVSRPMAPNLLMARGSSDHLVRAF